MNSTTVILDNFKPETVSLRTSFQVQINGHDCTVSGSYSVQNNTFWVSTINGEFHEDWANEHKIDWYELSNQLQELYETRDRY